MIVDTISARADATQRAFQANSVEVVTHSNGIVTFNAVLEAFSGRLVVTTPFALDCARAQPVNLGLEGTVWQNLSGQTGGIGDGRSVGNFEARSSDRWKNEPQRDHVMRMFHNDLFDCPHNYAFPRHLLRFSIQITMG